MTKFTQWPTLLALALPVALAGCGANSSEAPRALAEPAATGAQPAQSPAKEAEVEPEVKANLAKLDPADRKLVEAQRYCVVEEENRLGAMGVPVKLLVRDRPVFVCCKSCRKQALAEPDKTLTRVDELITKAKASGSH
jgi:hypothetical protein